MTNKLIKYVKLLDPVVQSVVSLTSSLRVISLTVLADLLYNIPIFFAKKKATPTFSAKKKSQHICVSLSVNFNESLTNNIVSFEQLGPVVQLTSCVIVIWRFEHFHECF